MELKKNVDPERTENGLKMGQQRYRERVREKGRTGHKADPPLGGSGTAREAKRGSVTPLFGPFGESFGGTGPTF